MKIDSCDVNIFVFVAFTIFFVITYSAVYQVFAVVVMPICELFGQ